MINSRSLQGPALTLSILAALWIVVVSGLLILRPSTFNPATIASILQFSTILCLVSLGQALVILGGGSGIDLSVGGIVSLSSVLALLLVKAGAPLTLLPIYCVAIGVVLGAINGALVTKFTILPLIATLGTFFVYSGLALAMTRGSALSGIPDWLLGWGRGVVAGIPIPFLSTAVIAFILAAVVLMSTTWGRWIYAMGFNERAARLVGIPVDRARLVIYSISGALGGVAGLVSIAWLGSARPNIGQNLELESLTAAMLGGIVITGGAGGVGGVFAAVVLLVTVKTGLLQLNVNTVWQVGIVGALLVFVLLADRYWRVRR